METLAELIAKVARALNVPHDHASRIVLSTLRREATLECATPTQRRALPTDSWSSFFERAHTYAASACGHERG